MPSSLFEPLSFVLICAQGQIPSRFVAPSLLTSSLVTLCSLLMTCLIPRLGDAKALPDIYWNSSNPIFRIDNTEHIFVVRINDRVDLLCPFYQSSSTTTEPVDVEVVEIYSVSKWAYNYCALTPDSVVVGVCNNPFQRSYATVVFREYTPKPGGLEFKPGHSYYFISTSTGQPDGVQNKHGGLCSSKNMKVKFEVEPVDTPGTSVSKSIDGSSAAGGVAQTKAPRKAVDDDGYDDDQYQMASAGGQVEIDTSLVRQGGNVVSGPSRTHDNSREVKTNASGPGVVEVTTPRLYEIHTRPEGGFDRRTSDYKEHSGSNAQHRRNAASSVSSWRTVSMLFTVYSLYAVVQIIVPR